MPHTPDLADSSPAPRPTASSRLPSGPSASGRSDRSHHQVLASVSRMAVLELLRSVAQPVGVGEIAQQVGLHQNTVRSHLDLLVDSGYAIRRSEAPSGPGRPRVVYEATAAPEGERNFGLLAEVLAHHLATNSEHPGEAAIVAGRNWAGSAGRWSHRNDVGGTTAAAPLSEEAAVAETMRLLGDIGFAPEMSADGSSVYLHRCPFRELAASQPAVVCGTHLGILQGALAEMGAPFNATRLLPFVEPNLCIATLSRPPARRGRARRNRPPLLPA